MAQVPINPIQVDSLGKKVQRKAGQLVHAVRDLSFTLPARQICGLVGPNGAGKTSLLKLVAGLTPPSAGRVLLNGHDLSSERDAALHHARWVIEGCRSVQEERSVWENVSRAADKDLAEQTQSRARQFLHELGLWERRDDALNALSRGMQRQVALVCALAANPSILLLDEPTQYLDEPAARQVVAWIKQLAHEKGAAVLVATRQPRLAAALCDRVLVLRQGRLLADRRVGELADLLVGEFFQIRVKGKLDERRSEWFGDLTLSTEGEHTVLSGVMADQAALQGVLGKLFAIGISLCSVTGVQASPENALAHLMYVWPGEPDPNSALAFARQGSTDLDVSSVERSRSCAAKSGPETGI